MNFQTRDVEAQVHRLADDLNKPRVDVIFIDTNRKTMLYILIYGNINIWEYIVMTYI